MIDYRDCLVPAYTIPTTLCEVCAKACGGMGGCTWSRYKIQRPVEGWDAVRCDIKQPGDKGSVKNTESYVVLNCPAFVLEAHRREEYKLFYPEKARAMAVLKSRGRP